jgi:uncharacterized protein (DUF697 family)
MTMNRLTRIFSSLETVTSRLPKAISAPIERHLRGLEKLFAEGELEAARRSSDPVFKKEAAQKIVGTAAAICTTIGLEPIPLADFPLLTATQMAMVAAIIHVSGRKVSTKAAVEFIAALGVNIGAGMVLREGSRALLKFIPVLGNMASAGIAGAGTYAIGRAATAYFIDGVSLRSARELFRSDRKKLR